jgi:hypothetical protein
VQPPKVGNRTVKADLTLFRRSLGAAYKAPTGPAMGQKRRYAEGMYRKSETTCMTPTSGVVCQLIPAMVMAVLPSWLCGFDSRHPLQVIATFRF